MFEIGIRLRQERGPENVFDYTLGNPDVEPPEAVIEALRRVVAEDRPQQPRLHAQRRFPGRARGHRPPPGGTRPGCRSPAKTSS